MKFVFIGLNFVKEMFVVGYFKFFGMVDGLLERLFRDIDVKGVFFVIKFEV